MNGHILTLYISVPAIAGAILLAMGGKLRRIQEWFALAAAAFNLILAIFLFKQNLSFAAPWAGFGFEFLLKSYHFSNFIILSAAFFGLLITLYSNIFMRDKKYPNQFYAYLLLSLAMVNGAVLSDNLVLMLFFWEGLLITLFGMIAIGGRTAWKTASKAFIIVGICDLCLVAGIALTGHLAGTLTISQISLKIGGMAGLAFILLIIGAISKAGSIPFHTWIPDAAIDAPLPFMAFIPGAIEKLIGIYFLTRVSLDIFKPEPHSWASYLLMIVGSIGILIAVMMALVQKDYKRLLSYHAISQVGYMILGIGTMVPAGIIGGLFHMINNALYKSCLFLTGGSVERETGTTDLTKLGGIWRSMPITFICFLITAASISGVPPFNGFFSKELVYDGALERGMIFYLAAVIGSFLTAASFLKLGHAAFLGKPNGKIDSIKESPIRMLIPMITISAVCILFGLWNSIPINMLQPVLEGRGFGQGHDLAGFPANMMLVIVTVIVLIAAFLNHLYGVKRTGKGIGAVDHIHYAPVLKTIYENAEKRRFDPYNIGLGIANAFSNIAWLVDRSIDWVYNSFIVNLTHLFTRGIRALHNGSYKIYIVWSIATAVIIVIYLIH